MTGIPFLRVKPIEFLPLYKNTSMLTKLWVPEVPWTQSSFSSFPLTSNLFQNVQNTVILIMVVSLAVLAHDVSARAGDVSMGIAVLPIG